MQMSVSLDAAVLFFKITATIYILHLHFVSTPLAGQLLIKRGHRPACFCDFTLDWINFNENYFVKLWV